MHCNCLKEKGKLAFAWSFSHTHHSTDCKRSSMPLFSTRFALPGGGCPFQEGGTSTITGTSSSQSTLPCSPCRLPAPSWTARARCPPPAAPTACPLRSPNLPLQLTLARWETGVISPAQYTSFLQSSGALCALLSGCWGLIEFGGPGGPPELRTHPQP